MPKVLAFVVERPLDAQKIIDQVTRDCMCDRADISILARDEENWTSEAATKTADAAKDAIASGAHATAALFKAVFEGVQPVSRALPGGAMLRAAGDFGVKLMAGGTTTAADIANALIEAGVRRAEAQNYAQGLDRGGILITVAAKTDKMEQCVRKAMMAQGATPAEKAA